MKQIVTTIILSLSFILSSQAQTPPGIPQNAKQGACYAKSIVDVSQIKSEKSLAVYTGIDDLDQNENIEPLTVITEEGKTYWEKKGDKYELVQNPQQKEQIIIVKDISLTDDYVMEDFTVVEDIPNTETSSWRQVVCESKLSIEFLKSIQTNLRAHSFYNGAIDGIKTELLIQSLKNYQIQNKLPIGSFNYETLKALGVKIP